MPTEEIVTRMNEVIDGVRAVQEKLNRQGERLDSITENEIKSINDKVADNLEKAQAVVNEQKKLAEAQVKADARAEALEKMLCSMGKNKGTSVSDIEIKARDEFTNYLRDKKPLSEDVCKYIVADYVEKSFYGLSDEEKNQISKKMLAKQLSVGVSPSGGYYVRPQINSKIITRAYDSNPMRQYASVLTIQSDSLETIIDDEEYGSTQVGETQARPQTETGEIGELLIYAKEQYANVWVTQKMLDDAGFDVESYVANKIQRRFTRQENRNYVLGSGPKEPQGFLTLPAWDDNAVYQRGAIAQIPTAGAGAITGDDLKDLQTELNEIYQPGAVFAMNRKTFNYISKLVGTDGHYLLDVNSLKTGDTSILLGRQVAFMDAMSDVANNALAVAYADFSTAYTIVDRLGMRIIRDEVTTLPYIKIYAIKRSGGGVTSWDGIKILKVSS